MEAFLQFVKRNEWLIITLSAALIGIILVSIVRLTQQDADLKKNVSQKLLAITASKFIKSLLEAACVIVIFVSGSFLTHQQDNIVYIGLTTNIAVGIAFLVIFEGLPETWASGLLLGAASFACASVLGLIFGIPPSIDQKSVDSVSPNGSLAAAQALMKTKDDASASAKAALDKAKENQSSTKADIDAANAAFESAKSEDDAAKQEVKWWSAGPEQINYLLQRAKDETRAC